MENKTGTIRRLLSLVLTAGALCSMLLVGCGKKPAGSDPGSSSASSLPESADPSDIPPTAENDPTTGTDGSGTTAARPASGSSNNSKTAAAGGSTAKTTGSSAAATTTKSSSTSSSALKQSAYVKDSSVWKSKMLSSGKFFFEVEMTSIGTMNSRLLKNSITKLKVGEYQSLLPSVKAAEWGYSVVNLPTGTQDGAGRVMQNVYLDNLSSLKTRADALAKIKEFVLAQYVRGQEHPWYSMNGHHSWHHYAGEFGFDVLASEIGENIHGYQFHLAMNRGAARQYGKPWAIDFSSWHGAGILD